jgi:DNA-binding response OmpR family regulator
VEDDERIVRLLHRYFTEQGAEVESTGDTVLFFPAIERFRPDIVLLDWTLPTRSGILLLDDIRRHPAWQRLPVIMLSIRSEEIDLVEGLLGGADDYVSKPFRLAELTARMISVLRRHSRLPVAYRDGTLEIDPQAKKIRLQGNVRTLSAQEWSLLAALLSATDPLSRENLIAAVWGQGYAVSERALDVLVLRLRRAVEPDPQEPRYILTERGAGYRFYRRDTALG